MEDDELKNFIRGLVREKAKVELDKDIEDQLVGDLYDRLENQIYRELVGQLNDEQLEELNRTERTPEEILKFIENCGIIIQDTITKVLVRFRNSYISA